MKKKNNIEKKKLVNLFKVMDHYKLNDLTANHASVLSKDGKGFFINQHKLLFSEISQNNLKYVSLNDNYSKKNQPINKAGFFIHLYLHNSKAKPGAILHTHSINSVAISCLKNGFNEKLNQSSMRFYKRIEYFDYSGMVINEKIAKELFLLTKKDTKVIILKNHGNIILAKNIEELFHLTYHFEKCAEIQMKIMKNEKINIINNKIAKLTCEQHESFGKVGEMSWKASLRVIKKTQ